MQPQVLSCAVLCCAGASVHGVPSWHGMPYRAAAAAARRTGQLAGAGCRPACNTCWCLPCADGESEEGVAAVLGTIRPASGGGEDTSSTDEEVAATPTGKHNHRVCCQQGLVQSILACWLRVTGRAPAARARRWPPRPQASVFSGAAAVHGSRQAVNARRHLVGPGGGPAARARRLPLT